MKIPMWLYKGAVILAIISIVAGAFYWLWNDRQYQKAEKERYSDNLHSIVQTPGKTTQEFDVSKKEFKVLFPFESRQLDSLKKAGQVKPRVQSYQRIIFEYVRDTVLVPVPVAGVQTVPSTFEDGNVWTFEDNCITAELSKADTSDLLNFKLSGEIPINIITDLYRPKRWFIKFQWFRFSDSTKVTTPCGLQIKENVKFNFK